MKTTRIAGLHYWSEFQSDKRIDFNGFFVEREGGGLLVDPMPLDDDEAEFIAERGGVRWVLVTNPDHLRDALALAQRFEAEVAAPAADRDGFGEAAAGVALWFDGTPDLPQDLRALVTLHFLEGGKSAREAVLELPQHGALLFGDAVRSHESGRLRLLPDPKVRDGALLRAGLRALADRRPRAILLGDGDCIFNGATEAWNELISSI